MITEAERKDLEQFENDLAERERQDIIARVGNVPDRPPRHIALEFALTRIVNALDLNAPGLARDIALEALKD